MDINLNLGVLKFQHNTDTNQRVKDNVEGNLKMWQAS